MANSLITPTMIAKEALMQLENNLVMAKCVHRDYSKEFVKVGSSVNIRRPVRFDVTDGATLSKQNVEEGNFSVSIDKQKHVGWEFSSEALTLTIEEYSERYIKPAMIALANRVDQDLCDLYKDVWNWVGTPGQTVNSFADFAKAPERLTEGAVPKDNRHAVLSPADNWGLIGSQTSLYFDSVGKPAYREGSLGKIGGVETYEDQNVGTLAAGTRTNSTPLVAAAGTGVLSTTYAASKSTGTMVLPTDGWGSSVTIAQGDVFTISGVYAINPVSKVALPYLQQFVVKAAVTADQTTTNETPITIAPPIITSGPYQTVDSAPADGDTITIMGTASTNYRQNMVFHKNAFALVMRDLAMPDSVGFKGRESHNGFSVRVVKDYDIDNDNEIIRLDILYGVKTLYADLATRLSGTA